MKIIKNDSLNKEDMTNKPLFYGGQVSREEIVGNETSSYFNFSLVHFDTSNNMLRLLQHLENDDTSEFCFFFILIYTTK